MKNSNHFWLFVGVITIMLLGLFLWLDNHQLFAEAPTQARPTPTTRASRAALNATAQITIMNSGFVPEVLTTTVANSVTWYNATSTVHQLQSGTPLFTLFLPLISRSQSGANAPILEPTPVRVPTRVRPRVNGVFSGTIQPSGYFTTSFDTIGTYPYFLTDAPSYQGRIIVQSAPDFLIGTFPTSRSIVQGQSITYTTQLTSVNSISAPVTLGILGLPTGTSATFAINPLMPTASTIFTITTQPSIVVGTYPLTVTGNSGSMTHTNSITLSVVGVQANLCGSITTDTILPTNTYTVTCDLTINNGANLTIQSGTTIMFNQNTGLYVNGALTAIGTTSQPITFTANSGSPTRGFWRGLIFGTTSSYSLLERVTVMYGGYGNTGNIQSNGTWPVLVDSTVGFSSNYGIQGSNASTIAITRTTFISNTSYAAFFGLGDRSFAPILSGLAAYGNGTNGIALAGTFTSTVLPGNPGIPYVNRGLNVRLGGTLTVQAGAIIKSADYGIGVQGKLAIQGSDSNPVILTSLKDDTAGGDTNNDGSVSQPSSNDWSSITIASTGSANIDHAIVRYGGYQPYSIYAAIYVDGGSLTLSNSTLSDISQHGVRRNGGTVTVDSTTFTRVGGSGVYSLVYQTNALTVTNSTFDTVSTGVTIQPQGCGASTSIVIRNNFFTNTYYPIWVGTTYSGCSNYLSGGTSIASNTGISNTTNGVMFTGVAITGTITLEENVGLPYVLDVSNVAPIQVPAGSKLTVSPGVIFKITMRDNYVASMAASGELAFQGTAAKPIVITSFKDDSFAGDTNHDGVTTSPRPGDWSEILIMPNAIVSLSHTIVRYGGNAWGTNWGAVALAYGGNLKSADSEFSYNVNGITAVANSVTVTNTRFISNTYGILFDADSTIVSPTLRNNIFTNNHGAILFSTGKLTGDSLMTGNTGSGNETNGIVINVPFTGTVGLVPNASFPYVLSTGTAVNTGSILKLYPGTIIKFSPSTQLTVNGALVADATASSPIVFTSLKDDTYGGDTNNDGNSISPAPGDWQSIYFAASSDSSQSVLNYAMVRYGGSYVQYGPSGGVILDYASPRILNSVIAYAKYGAGLVLRNYSNPIVNGNTFLGNGDKGLYVDSGSTTTATIRNNIFQNNVNEAIWITANSDPVFSSNTAIGNGTNAIVVYGPLSQTRILNPDLTYVLDGPWSSFSVNNGVTLTLSAGVVVKLRSASSSVTVNGTLTANGTSSNPAVFTSLKDDAYGGDTNNDGGVASPSGGDWGSILINTMATAMLQNVVVRFGGASSNATMVDNQGSLMVVDSTFSFSSGAGISDLAGSPSFSVIGSTFTSEYYGIFLGYRFPCNTVNHPIIMNNMFTETSYPIYANTASNYNCGINAMRIDSNFSGNTGNNNKLNGIYLHEVTITGTSTLVPNPNFPYVVGILSVSTGATLTLAPGTLVKVNEATYGSDGSLYTGAIDVRGSVFSLGDTANPVVITSIADDEYGGDTNSDGNATIPGVPNPTSHRWAYLSFEAGSLAQITNTIIRNGGANGWWWVSASIAINGRANLDGVIIEKSATTGLTLAGGQANTMITNSLIRNNTWYGVRVQSNISSTQMINNSQIYGNASTYGLYGIYNEKTTSVDARYNWWGDTSGPAPYGSGNGINYNTYSCTQGGKTTTCYTFRVDVDPWLGKDTYVANRNARSSSATTFGGDPVNAVFGNYTYQHTDFSVPSIGLPFTFQRAYNSANASTNGTLGYGWTHSFALTAIPQTYGTSNLVVIALEDGRKDSYTDNGNGTFTPPPGTFDILTVNAGLYTLTRKDQTRYSFNSSGKLASIVDKNGNTMTLNYLGGNLASVVDTAGRTYSFTNDGSGRITQISDPLGRTVLFTYDASGNLATNSDPRAKTTTYAYDASHRLTSITDANGHAFVQNTYNSDGRVVQQRDAKLNLTAFAYYTQTLRTVITDTRGYATTYDYDTQYRVTSERDALNKTLSYVYNASNNRTQVTDKRGNTTRYVYDSLGNTTFITDALTNIYRFTYDSHNNLLTKTDPLSRVTTNTYDAHDNLLTTTNISGTTTFGYNARGLFISVTDANGHTTQYGYNANGDQTSITDPLGNITSATFDNGGRRLTQTDPLGHTTTFANNANNNLTTITDALIHTTTYTYDNVGNKTEITDANGSTTYFAYDEKDQLVTVTDARGGNVTYAYDAMGNKTRMTDANGHATNYTYDALNRLLTVNDPLAHTTTYGYDANGNKTSIVDAKSQTTTFTYDALNRLTRIQYPTYQVNYTYDALGNRLTMVDPTGTTSYTYDGLDRLTRVQSPISNIQYTYDAVGNRTSIVYPNSNSAVYIYDDANRLRNVTDWASRVFTYTYDEASNRTGLDDPNGAHTAYTYDTLNRLTAITTTTPVSGTIFFARYSLDNTGNRTQMVDSEGTTNYTYDVLYRLTGVIYPDATSTQYAYDTMGNRTTLTSTVSGVTNYTYDVANRLLSAGATTLTWDNNGNQLTKGTATYQYDVANRLTQVVNGGTTDQFTYDGDGKRSTKTVNGTATNYAYDVNVSLPFVLTETTGGATTSYLYGADLLTQYDNGGNPMYYHADGLGSVRAMSNSAGQKVATNNYDTFGAVRNSSGAASIFKFAGEQSDNEAGLIYLRARFYDPAIGRFLSRDPFPGFPFDTQSVNKYPYAQNNPVIRADRQGKFIVAAIAVGVLAVTGVELYNSWSTFLQNADQTEKNLKGYYQFDFENPDWQAKYNDYNPEMDIFKTARSGLYAGLKTPGTSISGAPPSGVSGIKGIGVILKWMMNKIFGFKEPMDNHVTPHDGNTQSQDGWYDNTGSGYSWGGPPSQGK